MKKSLLFLAAAALALASCNNDVKIAENQSLGNEPQEIAFSPLTHSSLRVGAGPQSGSLADTYDMYVAAYQASPNAGDYFGETNFVNYTSGKWHGYTPQYWPLAVSTLNFLAVTSGPTGTTRVWGEDTSEPADGTTDENWAKKVVVTMADNRTAQHDMMWAIGQGSVTQPTAGGALVFPEVSMAFKHTLALIKFTEKVSSTASGKIKLVSITLNNAKYNGILTVTCTDYATTPTVGNTTAAWSSLGDDANAVVPGWTGSSSALTNTADYAAVGNGLMIIPQATAGFASFTVAYQIQNPSTSDWDDYSYTYIPTAPTNRIVAQGYQYTYNITFNLNEIVIAPTVETWSTGAGQDITIQ